MSGKPGRSGRKSFVATPEQRNNVKILVGLGVPQAMICQLVVTPQTGKPLDEGTLKKHFSREIGVGAAELHARMGSFMVANNRRSRLSPLGPGHDHIDFAGRRSESRPAARANRAPVRALRKVRREQPAGLRHVFVSERRAVHSERVFSRRSAELPPVSRRPELPSV
jgi:hypothetical protein